MKNETVNANALLLKSVEDYVEYSEGKSDLIVSRVQIPLSIDVKAIRQRLGLSQDRFADRFNLALPTLRNWEQGKRKPEQPIAMLLHLIDRFPDQVAEEVNALRRRNC